MTLLRRLWATRRGGALIGAGLLVLAGLSLVVGVWTTPGQWLDNWVYGLVLNLIPGTLRQALDAFARPFAPLVLTPVAAVLGVIGVRRRKWGEVVTAAVLTALIPLTHWLRESVITRPDLGVGDVGGNTFPSTHATAGFAVITAILILWPGRVGRGAKRIAAALAVLIGIGNVAWYAHRPVDVIGSACLVSGCALLLLAAFCSRGRRSVG